jgi:L-lactate dehydrogenase
MSKIAVVGTGFVGSTIAYSILHRGIARELVLVDTDAARAEGEAMDLSHALPFLKNARISASPLETVDAADLVIVAAGRNSVPGETRMDLLKDNVGRVRSICKRIKTWNERPIVLIVSNPVDVLTQAAFQELGDHGKVLGSGTTLDTARLRTLLGTRFGFDPHSIHGYILGEHGDSEFPAWSTVTAGGVSVEDWPGYDEQELKVIFEQVRTAAYEIIKRKRATYFAIGAATALIAEAILRDQRSILPVSVPLNGQYGIGGISLSLPCVLGRGGVVRVLEPGLTPEERRALARSAETIRRAL